MERPTGMRNRLVALSAVLAFALVVTGVAVVAGSGGDKAKLEKLSFAAAGGDRTGMSIGAPESALYPNFGPVEYRVKGDLPDLADKAPAYRLGAITTKQDVAELAATLGVTGDVAETDEGWSVRSGNRQLNVQRSPGLPWFLSTACTESSGVSAGGGETVVSSGCASAYATPMMPRPAMAGGAPMPATAPPPPPPAPPTSSPPPCRGGTVECQPVAAQEAPTTTILACAPGTKCVYPDHEQPPMPPRDPDLPTRPEAERIARDLASKLEVDVDRLEVYDGFQSWRASIESRVGGLPTLGRGTSMAIGPKGRITEASGFLAEPDRIGDYPLVGTAKALERLRAGTGFGPGYLGGPRPLGPGPVPATAVARPAGEPATGDAECSKPTVICDPPPTFPEPPVPVTTTVPCPPEADCVAPSPPQAPPPAPRQAPHQAPGPPAPAQPMVINITGVHLALQQVGPALVPVYVFEVEGPGPGFTPPVPAVTDEWIENNKDYTER